MPFLVGFAGLGPPELLIIFAIVVVLFGAGRISGIGGAIGKSIREFRREVKEDEKGPEENKEKESIGGSIGRGIREFREEVKEGEKEEEKEKAPAETSKEKKA